MRCNVEGIERPIRIGLGILLLGLGAFGELPTTGMTAALIVGMVALVTGTMEFCQA